MPTARDPARPLDRRVRVAANLLQRVFAAVAVPLGFRLWDGTPVSVGDGESAFAVVFGSREVFRRVLLRPTPLRFGEAFIAGELDIEGDILAAMRAADAIERLRVPLGTRLAVLAGLMRL
jgi:cyclopropane-fatty-acyl-phospholipid synthase